MTDDGSGCNAKLFAGACRWLGLKRSRTKPSTPRSNGRAADLPRWLTWHTDQQPHSGIGGLPSVSKLHFQV